MDQFGIGNAAKAMLRILMQSSRATGRTTALMDSLKNGDRVLVGSLNEKQHFERECKKRGLDVEVVVTDSRYEALRGKRPALGRTVFEHTLVEKMYADAVEMCAREIDEVQNRYSSGPEIKLYTHVNERWESI